LMLSLVMRRDFGFAKALVSTSQGRLIDS
jgi:hypothetical protein